MDLQLGLSLSSSSASSDGVDLNGGSGMEIVGSVKKRCFDEAFDGKNSDHRTPLTLPLLVWNDLPEQAMHDQDYLARAPVADNRLNRVGSEDDYEVVGWPPINSWRKRNCCGSINCGDGTRRGRNSLFVKVKMEGVGIARKVDLSLYHSLETLRQTLLAMFGKCRESVHAYQLSFQDKEGFWQLAEDVAWGNLIRSVHRLQLRRKV